jgi:flagellar protein FliO/FliZ
MKKKSYIIFNTAFSIIVYESVNPRFVLSAENFSLFNSSLKMIWGLLIVLGILLIIYGLVKKRVSLLQGGGKGIIKIIESRHLMPKKSLFLIEVRGREYLVGSGGDSLNLIASIDDENHSNSTFESILKDTESSKPA